MNDPTRKTTTGNDRRKVVDPLQSLFFGISASAAIAQAISTSLVLHAPEFQAERAKLAREFSTALVEMAAHAESWRAAAAVQFEAIAAAAQQGGALCQQVAAGVTEMFNSFQQMIADMPEEERAEFIRQLKDAPLERVDVNASEFLM
jgi:hypothetical protein